MFVSGKSFTLCLVVVTLVVFTGCVNAQSPDKVTLSAAEITEKYGPAVVLVLGLDASKQSSVLGTGFMVTASGVFVTNYHVVQGVYPAQVRLASGDVYDAISVIDTDERKDIAVLKIKGFNLPVVQLADSDSVKVGSEVVVIGNPKGLEGTVTNGLVSAIRDTGEGYKIFQMSAPISPGSSGSPVFDKTGQVIGIATATVKDGQNLNFAVPINYVTGMVSEKEKMTLEEFSKSAKPALIDTSAGTVKLDADDWGKRMVPIILEILEGEDTLALGSWETGYPHTKKFRPDRFAISPSLYVGAEKLKQAIASLKDFEASDSGLREAQSSVAGAADKLLRAAEKEIELYKTVPGRGFDRYNAGQGEVHAMIAMAEDAICSPNDGIVRVFEKQCQKQLPLLPYWLRTRSHPEAMPGVVIGIVYWNVGHDMVVMYAVPGTPADKAGFKNQDVIVGVVKGVKFQTWEEWYSFMRTKKPGDEVRFEVLREGKTIVLKAKLAAREE